jgi:hypothetical protein
MKQSLVNLFMLPIQPILFIFWLVVTILVFLNSNIQDIAMADENDFINPELEEKINYLFKICKPFMISFCIIVWFYVSKYLFLNY